MSSKLGTTACNGLLGLAFGNTAYSPPATYYVALLTTAPTDYNTGAGAVEVSGGSYARAAVANNTTNFAAPSGRSMSNGATISFPAPTANWGAVVGFGLYSAANGGTWHGGGDMTPKTINNGDPAQQFGVGALTIALP